MSYKEDQLSKLEEMLDNQTKSQQVKPNPQQNKHLSKEERKALYSQNVQAKKKVGGANAGGSSDTSSTNVAPQRRQSVKGEQGGAQQQKQPQQKQQKQQQQKAQKQKGSAGTPTAGGADLQEQIRKLQEQLNSVKQNRLFSHLDQYVHPENKTLAAINDPRLHPAIVQLGLQYATGAIRGSNARTTALLVALKQVAMDYVQPEQKFMNRDLDAQLVPMINYLKMYRPMSVGMGNALKQIKTKIHALNPDLPEHENKKKLISDIETYINERIVYAVKLIVKNGVDRIKNGDTIMTYARSEVVEQILIQAKESGKDFRVIVVDARPKHEGKELLRRLASVGINCSFIYINAVSHIMNEVSKVMIGAHSMLSNGSVFSRIGTASVCMMANAYNVPVLVCCETYKFSESSQLDSITRNELGDPYELCSVDREDVPEILHDYGNNIQVLNLTYDVTPMEYVDMVITEVGLIPPTSVPVILREFHSK